MPTVFHYDGRDMNGNAVAGDLSANSIEDVISHLKNHSIIPINIVPAKKSIIDLSNIPSLSTLLQLQKVEPYHLMNFFRQLAVLSDAGLSIIRAINKLAETATSRSLSTVLFQVANDIAAGFSLADALKKHQNIFSPLMINVIDIGENTGHLGDSLRYLSTYMEASITNHRRLLTAIRYPFFVTLTIAAAILVMNFMVIPKFSMMFSKFNLELPLATRLIMASSNFMVANGKILLILAIVLFFGIRRSLKIPSVRYVWDKHKLRLPIFGSLQRRILISQFTWTFSLILRSGIPIIKGIQLTSTAIENAYFGSQLAKMGTAIEHGENLSRSAIASGLFTPITIQMIEVGEESEKLDEALTEVAKYYDAEIDYDLKRLNELIEPILLMMIGSIVMILAIGIYFPLWDLIKVANL
jgi:MSHA biogenesis protein MshG